MKKVDFTEFEFENTPDLSKIPKKPKKLKKPNRKRKNKRKEFEAEAK